MGNSRWLYDLADHTAGSGLIKNASTFNFDEGDGSTPELTGDGSGVASVDSGEYGTGNLLICTRSWIL